jgi:hypothetical protein
VGQVHGEQRLRRRALRGGANRCARLAAIALSLVVLVGVAPAHGHAQDTRIPLMIQTVPAMSGMRFSLDGRTFTSDGNGLALITVGSPGTYNLSVLPPPSREDVRADFHRWSDGSQSSNRSIDIATFTSLDAGFEVSYLTSFSLRLLDGAAVDADRVESIAVAGSDGSHHEFTGGGPHWLTGVTTVMEAGELAVQRISYQVTEAVVDGQNIVQAPEGAFTPQRGAEWSIETSATMTDAPGAAREVEVVQPATTNEPSINRLVLGLVLAVALLVLLCLMLLRRRPAARPAMAAGGAPMAALGPARTPQRQTRAKVTRASRGDDAGATSPPPQAAPPKEGPTKGTPAPEVKADSSVKPPAPSAAAAATPAPPAPPPKATPAARPQKAEAPKPPSQSAPPQDDSEVDSYEKLGRKVSSILGSAYESADKVQRAARNDARAMLDDALEDGTTVRDRAREQSERDREKAEAKAQEIIEDAESYADQVREKTRRRVAELEEHLRRHQRLRAREQELRHILAQIEDMIPKLRGEMDDSEARQESKA